MERLRADLDAAERSQRAAQAGATHLETRAEGPKDMRSTEASYVARGLAERVESLGSALAVLEAHRPRDFDDGDAVSLGSLVLLADAAGQQGAYLIVPSGGGETLDFNGTCVRTLTPASPLGRRLAGCVVGDVVLAPSPGGPRELTVVALR